MSLLGISIFAAWSWGIFIITFSISGMFRHRRRLRAVFVQDHEENDLGSASDKRWFSCLKDRHEQRMSFIGLTWSWKRLLIYLSLLGGAGGGMFYQYLNNALAAILWGTGCSLILYGYLNFAILKKQNLLEKQLIPAIQVFLSEFGSIPNIVSALNNTLMKVEQPLKEEIDILVRELNSGRGSEEALFSFAGRVGCPWAFRFAHILNLRINKGINISPMLFNLYLDMKTRIVKEKERSMESIGARLESYTLYVFIPVMYFFARQINPQTHYLLTQTAEGRKVMLYLTLLLLAGIISTIRLGNNKIR
jgi:Flp pilus assembly protein TadB